MLTAVGNSCIDETAKKEEEESFLFFGYLSYGAYRRALVPLFGTSRYCTGNRYGTHDKQHGFLMYGMMGSDSLKAASTDLRTLAWMARALLEFELT